MIDEILRSFDLNLQFLKRLIADLDPDQMVQQPQNVPNHPAWTIGHLVYSCQQISGELGIPSWLPAEWATQFGTGSTPVADSRAYPAKGVLLEALADGRRRVVDAVTSAGEKTLAEPLPDERYRDRLPTIGVAVLHILAAHTALHLGQLTVWRKAMGLPREGEPLAS